MNILIVSDTHRNNANYFKVLERLKNVDMVVHCGDAEGSEYSLKEACGCEFEIVLGNNDFFSNLPAEREFMIGKYKVWLVHGHRYQVSLGNELLRSEARDKGVDIVIYGHTHRPEIVMEDGLVTLNPGSLTYPRQIGHEPSYLLMEIDRNGEAHYTICYLKKE